MSRIIPALAYALLFACLGALLTLPIVAHGMAFGMLGATGAAWVFSAAVLSCTALGAIVGAICS